MNRSNPRQKVKSCQMVIGMRSGNFKFYTLNIRHSFFSKWPPRFHSKCYHFWIINNDDEKCALCHTQIYVKALNWPFGSIWPVNLTLPKSIKTRRKQGGLAFTYYLGQSRKSRERQIFDDLDDWVCVPFRTLETKKISCSGESHRNKSNSFSLHPCLSPSYAHKLI